MLSLLCPVMSQRQSHGNPAASVSLFLGSHFQSGDVEHACPPRPLHDHCDRLQQLYFNSHSLVLVLLGPFPNRKKIQWLVTVQSLS